MNKHLALKLTQLPPLLLAALLQLAPFCRAVFLNPTGLQTGFAVVFRWAVGAGIAMGAVDAVSGASATIAGLKPKVNNVQIGAISLTPSIPGSTDKVSLQIIVNNPGSDHQQDYWDCTPVEVVNSAGLTIDTSVGAPGIITNLAGQLTVAGVYNVTLKAGNTSFGFITANATITITNANTGGSPPTITSPPTSQTVNAGSSATFSVTAGGTGPFTYQWRKGGVTTGPDSPNLTFNPVTSGDAGSYDVVVSNSGGSVTSTPPAVLTVIVPPVIQTQPSDQSAYLGGSATFTVAANSDVPVTYQWRKHGTTSVGSDSPSLIINPVTAIDADTYDVVVSNSAGSVTSTPPAQLTILQPPEVGLTLDPQQLGAKVVSWQAVAGKTYTLQRRDNFSPDVWHDVGTTNVTSSGTVQMTDATAAGVNIRFYQIRTQ